MAAIAMLCVSAVMLTGVSYAWFTLSTNPEVTNIKANVSANENLEIALDNAYDNGAAVDTASTNTNPNQNTTGNPYTWGNLVDLNEAFSNALVAKLVIAPVAYDSTSHTLTYPTYGTDGRVAATNNSLNELFVTDKSGVTAGGGVAVYGKANSLDGNTTYDAFSVAYWLRSNETCTVSLSDVAKRANSSYDTSSTSDVNSETGAGSYITFKAKTSTTDNTFSSVREYAKELVIRFDYYDDTKTYQGSVYAALTETSDTTAKTTDILDATGIKYTLALVKTAHTAWTADDSANIELTANTAKLVKMYVYLDGETVTNADALLDTVDMEMNIQFNSSAIGGATENSKITPGAMDGATVTTTNTSGNNGN
jgi:hypothetical protein